MTGRSPAAASFTSLCENMYDRDFLGTTNCFFLLVFCFRCGHSIQSSLYIAHNLVLIHFIRYSSAKLIILGQFLFSPFQLIFILYLLCIERHCLKISFTYSAMVAHNRHSLMCFPSLLRSGFSCFSLRVSPSFLPLSGFPLKKSLPPSPSPGKVASASPVGFRPFRHPRPRLSPSPPCDPRFPLAAC